MTYRGRETEIEKVTYRGREAERETVFGRYSIVRRRNSDIQR